MNNDNIAKRKFDMLMQTYKQAMHQDEVMSELKDAAFEVLLLNPGCDVTRWEEILCKQYGNEVIDAYGYIDAHDILRNLDKLWKTSYHDENSGLEHDYKTWAEIFATEAAVKMYYDLIKQKVT